MKEGRTAIDSNNSSISQYKSFIVFFETIKTSYSRQHTSLQYDIENDI